MSQTAILGCLGTANYTGTSSTIYGAFSATSATGINDTTEADFQMNFRQGTCTLQNFYLNVGVMTQTQNATSTVDISGTPSAVTTTITASTTGTYTDLTHTASAADTDKVTYSLTTGSGAGNISLTGIGIQCVVSSQATKLLTGIGSQANNTSRFYCFAGNLSAQLEDTNSSFAIESATTSHMQAVIPVNSSTGFTCRFRINTAGTYGNGNQNLVVGSAATGLFEDTTNTDSIASGNLYNFNKPAASASATLTAVGLKYTGGTTGTTSIQAGSNGSGLVSGLTRFLAPSGAAVFQSSELQTIMPGTATFSVLSTYLKSNSSTSDMTMVFRNGGVTKNESVTLTGSASGLFQDLTHTDSVAAGDKIAYQCSGANSSTNVWESVTALVATSGGSTPANSNLLTLGIG